MLRAEFKGGISPCMLIFYHLSFPVVFLFGKGNESLTFSYVCTTIVDISDLNKEGYSELTSLFCRGICPGRCTHQAFMLLQPSSSLSLSAPQLPPSLTLTFGFLSTHTLKDLVSR